MSAKKGKPSPEAVDISGLSDAELTNQLRELGVNVGPIIDSTRSLYQKKLSNLLSGKQKATPVKHGGTPVKTGGTPVKSAVKSGTPVKPSKSAETSVSEESTPVKPERKSAKTVDTTKRTPVNPTAVPVKPVRTPVTPVGRPGRTPVKSAEVPVKTITPVSKPVKRCLSPDQSHDDVDMAEVPVRQDMHEPMITETEPSSEGACGVDGDAVPQIQETRCLILGKTGVGKSSTGNSILGESCFDVSAGCTSITANSRASCASRCGQNLTVVDTPGLFDTEMSQDSVAREIFRGLCLTAPGPHAFLLVFNGAARFTSEDRASISKLKNLFGEDMMNYSIIVLTRVDEIEEQYGCLEEYIMKSTQTFRNLVEECGHRIVGFDNKNTLSSNAQVNKLCELIVSLNANNQTSPYFTNQMFKDIEDRLKELEDSDLDLDKGHKKRSLEQDILNALNEHSRVLMDVRQTMRQQIQQDPSMFVKVLKRIGPPILTNIATRVATSFL